MSLVESTVTTNISNYTTLTILLTVCSMHIVMRQKDHKVDCGTCEFNIMGGTLLKIVLESRPLWLERNYAKNL